MPNTTAIIAALPAPLEPIRLVGDEEKHATLLFFGETATLPSNAKTTLTDLVFKASQMIFPFSESIVDITRLGSDTPPALVAKLTNDNLDGIRGAFALNSDIESYLKNATQHPGFTPHVTLGYPDYTQEQTLRDLAKSLYRVRFDRLALWWNDERFEFSLSDGEISHSESDGDLVEYVIQNALAHHGVKGMKWGVRKDYGHAGQRAKTKTIAKADKKFEKTIARANSGQVTLEFHNAVTSRINARVQQINDSPKYRLKNMDAATGKIKQDYNRDMQKAIVSSFEDGVRQIYGSNASGTKSAVYNAKTDRIDIVEKNVQHADAPKVPDVSVILTRNKTGHVIGIDVVPLVKDAQLAHYGVKGMHWGVRKDRSSGVPSGTTRVSQKAPGKKLKSEGGKGFPAHADAIKTAHTKQIVKKSGLHALSNAEIQQAVARMNLEQQYSRLSKQSGNNPASKFISGLLGNVAKQQATKVANDLAAQQVAQALKKNAA